MSASASPCPRCPKSVLSIAGSDSSGGAGIQADIKTIEALGLYAQTAITALTAQNTTGVAAVAATEPTMVAAQIDAVFADIVPDAVKVGMIPSGDVARAVVDRLRAHGARNIVVDPVMVATSGAVLADHDAVSAELFGLATLVTPNIPEAEALLGRVTRQECRIASEADAEHAAMALACHFGCAFLVKGGHGAHDANDVLATGCTLSSAIACGLAQGLDVPSAVEDAKKYLEGCLRAHLDLGRGSGPLDHMWRFF